MKDLLTLSSEAALLGRMFAGEIRNVLPPADTEQVRQRQNALGSLVCALSALGEAYDDARIGLRSIERIDDDAQQALREIEIRIAYLSNGMTFYAAGEPDLALQQIGLSLNPQLTGKEADDETH